MTGLVIKDIFSLKKQLRVIGLLLVVYGFLSYVQKSTAMLSMLMILYAIMTPVLIFSADEKCGWNKMVLAFPVSKKDVILSKYVSSLFFDVIIFFICFVLTIGLVQIIDGDMEKELTNQMYFICGGTVASSIMLPIIFRFGVTKGRYIFMVACLTPWAIVTLVTTIPDGKDKLFEIFTKLVDYKGFIPVISLIILLISYGISAKIAKFE